MRTRSLRVISLTSLLVGAVLLIFGCSSPAPVQVDAPQLASSLRWVGVCAVICSALGAIALIVASNRRK